MFEFLKSLFTKTVYKVVEVDRLRTPLRWDTETREAVATLKGHPGFIAIMDRLKLQRDMLLSQVGREFNATERQRDHRDLGVFWTLWLEDQVNKATGRGPSKQRDPLEEELEAFRAIDSQIERVG